jgi:small GTP-binding protein
MIADRYLQLKRELETGLADLLKLDAEMQRSSEELDTIQALLRDINEPLLFVVVGEVKSGKSSLINALFGQEVAKVDVLPTTDRVYIFRHGSEEKSTDVSPRLTERYLPIPFLRDFNVVDTPGTNTMVSEHQMVAEEFMPRADIVLFVFSVANPWTQSNWDFLNFLQETWLKNVVFVLQQIDLREPTEIDVIYRHLQDTAMRKLGFVPPIFAVSARKALLARTSGLDTERLWRESAFAPLEEQINLIVTESSSRMLKLRSTFQAGRVMLNELSCQIGVVLKSISRDEAVLNRVTGLVQSRREQIHRQVASAVRELETGYRDTAKERAAIFQQKLKWGRSFRLIWRQAAWQRDFETEIANKLRQSMQPQIERAVTVLENDLRTLWPQMQDVFENELSAELRKERAQNPPDFVRQRRELLNSVETALVETLAGESLRRDITRRVRQTSTWMRIAAVIGAVAVVVAVFAWAKNGTVTFVATVAALISVALGAFVSVNHNRKIARSYEQQLDPKGAGFVKALEERFGQAIDRFCKDIAVPIQNLSALCQTQRGRYEPWSNSAEELNQKFAVLKSRLG